MKKILRQLTITIFIISLSILSNFQTVYATEQNTEKIKTFEWLPGAARTIPRTESASRDRPVFEYAYGPYAQSSIGGEWGWFKVTRPSYSFRFGMYAMMGMENHDWETFFPPAQLWRGMTGFSWAWSADALAKHWFDKDGAFEISLVFAHESDHGDYDKEEKKEDIPYGGGGQFLTPDVAIRVPLGSRFLLTGRVQCRVCLDGALIAAPGADLIVRWRLRPWFNPTVAIFGEGIFPRESEARDGYFIRVITGAVFLGTIGEFTLFGSLDKGNGKGKLINQRETRISVGTRYAPFSR